MKKTLIIAIATAGMLYSCGGASKEDIKAAAEKMCSCMADKSTGNAEMSQDVIDEKLNADYSTCSAGAISLGVDPTTEDFTKAIAESCSELSACQEAFVKAMKQ